jgi:predicted membrane protein (TIGR00267 family)
MTAPDPTQQHHHTRVDPHHHDSRLSDVILGGQDGLVNVLGVILGVAAASHDTRIVIAAGLAATFAESVSMGAVAYTSTKADQALYQAEQERERRHVREIPELEREEIREIYRRKGFEGALLEKVVETITRDKEVWVAVMMAEELQLAPHAGHGAFRTALVVGVAALVGSLVPLWPFVVLPSRWATWVAMAVAAVVLFGVGVYKARTTVGHWLRSGAEMAVIGVASALAGYAVGLVFQAPAGH